MMIVMAYVMIHHVLIPAWDSILLLCEYKKYSAVVLKYIKNINKSGFWCRKVINRLAPRVGYTYHVVMYLKCLASG